MNNPNAPYRIPDDDGYEPQHFGLRGYESEAQMLDGLKTQAAVHQAIERPRVHYAKCPDGPHARLDNATGKWEGFPVDGSKGGFGKIVGYCPVCTHYFSCLPEYVPQPDEKAACRCGWQGTAGQLLPCVP